MKNYFLKILGVCLLFLAFGRLQAQTYYSVDSQPVCWTTGAGIDSTIYQVSLSPAGATKPTQMFFYTPIVGTNKVAAVTVTGGSIKAGSCFEKQSLIDNDTVINQLDVIVNLLGGNSDTCQVLNKGDAVVITSNTTYSANTRAAIAISAVSGTVTLSVDGHTAAAIQNGNTVIFNGRPCRYLDSSYTVNVSGGSALITWIY